MSLKKLKIKNDEIADLLIEEVPEFPKYTTQIMNLANNTAQGTRPNVVGQMSDLINEFDGNQVDEWIDWYEKKHPEARGKAVKKVMAMVDKYKEAIEKIDEKMIEEWVKDLIFYKTFVGLKFQEAILIKISSEKNTDYRLSTKKEEAKGIDGFIGNKSVSIKPISYKAKGGLSEVIDSDIIYYDKKKNGVDVYYNF